MTLGHPWVHLYLWSICGVSFRAISPVITLWYMYTFMCVWDRSYRILIIKRETIFLSLTCIHLHPPLLYSQYQINVSEIYSTLSLYNGWDYTEFTALAHVPLRPPNDYYPLSDISASGQSLDGSHINILAIVKNVRNISFLQPEVIFPDSFLILNSGMGMISILHVSIQTFTTYTHVVVISILLCVNHYYAVVISIVYVSIGMHKYLGHM